MLKVMWVISSKKAEAAGIIYIKSISFIDLARIKYSYNNSVDFPSDIGVCTLQTKKMDS